MSNIQSIVIGPHGGVKGTNSGPSSTLHRLFGKVVYGTLSELTVDATGLLRGSGKGKQCPPSPGEGGEGSTTATCLSPGSCTCVWTCTLCPNGMEGKAHMSPVMRQSRFAKHRDDIWMACPFFAPALPYLAWPGRVFFFHLASNLSSIKCHLQTRNRSVDRDSTSTPAHRPALSPSTIPQPSSAQSLTPL